MTDWIAQAEARWAATRGEGTDKTDESRVSSVLSVLSGGNGEIPEPGFVSFGSSFPAASASPAHTPSMPAQPAELTSSLPSPCPPSSTTDLLAHFRLDLIAAEMQTHAAQGLDVDEFRRVNNLAFYFITIKGWPLDTAMTEAAEWIVHHPEHPKERDLTNVLDLYHREVR